MQYYYLDAAVGCTKFKDVKKCQLLANLCVLQLYNEDAVACKLYKDTMNTLGTENIEYYNNEGFKEGNMPWLYYSGENA